MVSTQLRSWERGPGTRRVLTGDRARPSNVKRCHGRNAGDVWETFENSAEERPDADLMSPVPAHAGSPSAWGPLHHQPHQTPGQPFLERPALERLPRRIPCHDPLAAGMAQRAPHRSPAIASTVRDRSEQGILESAPL